MACVGPDLTAPGTRTACPSCGARVRPEATFCGQCYSDFRPPPPPPAAPIAPAPTATYSAPAADPLTAPLLDVVLPAGAVPTQGPAPAAAPAPVVPTGWPCTKCDTLNDFTDTICTLCAAPFLAAVSESTKVNLVLPIVGDLSRYGRGQRALIAVGALAAILIPLALITLLLTKTPPSGTPSNGNGGSGSSSTTGQPTGPVGYTGDSGTQNN